MTARPLTNDSMGITLRDAATPPVILVVDPDPAARAMYVAGLARSGWIADAVTDGREALAKAISCRPAAIVTETRVPRLDGFELCRLLRRDPDTQHIPILVVTSEAEEARIAAAEDAGADRVLVKPCLPDELARAIEATLSTRRDQQSRRVVTAPSVPTPSMSSSPSQSTRHRRVETTPLGRPPALVCPQCDRPLTYQTSHVGGVRTHREQWDHYTCPSGCGQFQYRQRTRKLRDVS